VGFAGQVVGFAGQGRAVAPTIHACREFSQYLVDAPITEFYKLVW